MARTSEFDREEVLTNAMKTFWEVGYNKTSIPQLTKATHLQPGSIYAAFKSKEGLFQATLEHYSQRGLKKIHTLITQAPTPLQGIKCFLESIVEEMANDQLPPGCFLVNSLLELAPQNKAVQAQISTHLATVESELFSALKAAHVSGELAPEKAPVALAKFLMLNIWGLRVMAKTNPDKESLKAVLAQLLLSLES
ncbi:TetR/AcrR family transcriptional regulator [Pseudomonadota bacterium]